MKIFIGEESGDQNKFGSIIQMILVLLKRNVLIKKVFHVFNDMVMYSLNHVPDVLYYLRRIKDEKIFRFCSIPQGMPITTLSQLCNNPQVFTSNVKIIKRLSYKIIIHSSNLDQAYQWFIYLIKNRILNKTNSNNQQMHQLINQIKSISH